MNIYELSLGFTKHFVVANDEQDAYKQGTDPARFPDIHYLPFVITKVEIPGYTISVTPETTPEKSPNEMDKAELKQWLKSNNIEFVPQWGEEKLRELVLQHAS